MGYHTDPTWAFKSTLAVDDIYLYYFMMTGERRADTGCYVDDLTAPLLPGYWVNNSSAEISATDDRYSFPDDSFLESIDEDNKTVRYICGGEEQEMSYAQN